jgi:hypothetical protein
MILVEASDRKTRLGRWGIILKWARHVAGAWDGTGACRISVETLDGKTRFGRGGIILKWIFKLWDGEALTRYLCLGIGTGGGRL